MNKSPLSGIVFAFMAGILVAKYTNIPFIIFWITSWSALIFSVIFLKSKRRFLIFLLFSILFLGGAALRNSQSLPYNHIANFTPYKGEAVYVEGVIDSDPVIGIKFTTFILKTQRLTKDNRKQEVCGKALVKVFGKNSFLYGDRLLIKGSIYKVPYFRISKRLNYRDYLKQRRIHSMLSVSKDSIVKLLDKGKGNPLKGLIFNIRHRMERIAVNNMSPFSSSILNAIILGKREKLNQDLRKIMVQTGTVHIIAISGLHVGLVSFIALMILRISRIPRRLGYIITALVLIIYCILTGARTPVVRVTLMALILFFGHIIMRQTNIYNTLSLAALIILLYNPYQLFNVSFQLSFMSIISIRGLSPRIKRSLFKKDLFTKSYLRILIVLFSGSLAAWIGLLPLIAYYFNVISIVAILANMIVVPYLSIVVSSGFLTLLVGFIYPAGVYIFSAACEASIIFLVRFISLLARLPGAYFYISDVPLFLPVGYYLFIGLVLLIGELENN